MNTILKPHLRKAALRITMVLGLLGGSQAAQAQLNIEKTHDKIAAIIGADSVGHIKTDHEKSPIKHKPHGEVGGFMSVTSGGHENNLGGGATFGVAFPTTEKQELTVGLNVGGSKHGPETSMFIEYGNKNIGAGPVIGLGISENTNHQNTGKNFTVSPLIGGGMYWKLIDGIYAHADGMYNLHHSNITIGTGLTVTLNTLFPKKDADHLNTSSHGGH